MLTYRYSSPADIPQIRQLCFQVWPQTFAGMLSQEQINYMLELMYSEDSLQQQMKDGVRYLLAYENSLPVGFASFVAKEENRFKLEKLYVLPEQQGKGTGRSFLAHIIRETAAAGAEVLYLQVKKTNPARWFYEKSGFSIVDEIVLDIGAGFVMDDYIMEREIRNL